MLLLRATDGVRTRDPDLGKVVLYQLSHCRIFAVPLTGTIDTILHCQNNVNTFFAFFLKIFRPFSAAGFPLPAAWRSIKAEPFLIRLKKQYNTTLLQIWCKFFQKF